MAKRENFEFGFRVTADVKQAQANIDALKSSLNKIASAIPTKGLSFTADMKEAVSSAKQLQDYLGRAFNIKTGNFDLKRLNQELKKGKTSLSDLTQGLLKAGTAGENAFMNMHRALATAGVQITQTKSKLNEFLVTLKNTARWQISSTILHGFLGQLQRAYGYAQQLNESLNDIRIVTGYGSKQMGDFAVEANKAAKALNTTTNTYAKASLIFYQQGLSTEEVRERTDVTIKMANVTKDSAEEVSNQLTAIWNNFDDGTKSLEYYADVITALGAATASSSKEISEGLTKFAAIADTVGMSYEYATSALATVTATTRQSADVVGTAFKTMFARIQDLELGNTLDDGTSLGKYSEALYKVGINIKDSTGNLKDMDDILDEMGAKWDLLAKDQQVALAQTVAGTRQYTQLVALMDNWAFMQENLLTAGNSEGTLQTQADIYAESWQAAQKEVKASMETLYNELIPTDFLIKTTELVSTLVDGLGDLIKAGGGLQTILLLLGDFLLQKMGPSLVRGLITVGDKISAIGAKIKEAHGFVKMAKQGVENKQTKKAIFSDPVGRLAKIRATDDPEKLQGMLMEGATDQNRDFRASIGKAMESQPSEYVKDYLKNISKVQAVQDVIASKSSQMTQEEREHLEILQKQVLAEADKAAEIKKQLDLDNLKKGRDLTYAGREIKDSADYSYNSNKNTSEIVFDKELSDTQTSSVQEMIELGSSNAGFDLKGNNVQIDSTGISGNGASSVIEAERQLLEVYSGQYEMRLKISQIAAQDGVSYSDKITAINKIVGASNNLTESQKDQIQESIKNTSNIKDTKTQAKALGRVMDETTDSTYDCAKAVGISSNTLGKIESNIEQVANGERNLDAQNEKLEGSFNDLDAKAQAIFQSMSGLAQGFTKFVQGITGLTANISMLAGAINTLSNADASWFAKLSAGSMMLMAYVGIVSKIISVVRALSGEQVKNTIATIANVFAKKANAKESNKGAKSTAKQTFAEKLHTKALQRKAAWLAIVTALQKALNLSSKAALIVILALAAAILVLVATIAIVKGAKEKARKQREADLKTAEENLESIKKEEEANRGLVDAYNEALKTFKDTGKGKEDLVTKAIAVADAYGIEGAAIDLLGGKYEDFNNKLNAAMATKERAGIEAATVAANAKGAILGEESRDGRGYADGMGGLMGNFAHGGSRKDEKVIRDVMAENDFQFFKYNEETGNLDFSIADRSDPHQLAQFYDEMSQIIALARKKDAEAVKDSEIFKGLNTKYADNADSILSNAEAVDEVDNREISALLKEQNFSANNITNLDEYERYRKEYLDDVTAYANEKYGEGSKKAEALIAKAKTQFNSQESLKQYAAESTGFDDLAKKLSKETGQTEDYVKNKYKKIYNDLSDDKKKIFWTIDIDKNMSDENLYLALEAGQKLLDSHKLVAKVQVASDLIGKINKKGKTAEDWDAIEKGYKDNGLEDIKSWDEFMGMSHEDQQTFLATYLNDSINNGVETTEAAIEIAKAQLEQKQAILTVLEEQAPDEGASDEEVATYNNQVIAAKGAVDRAQNDLNAAREDLQYIQDQLKSYQDFLKTFKFTKKSDIVDPYKELNDILSDIEHKLKRINNQEKQFVGANKIEILKKANKELERQNNILKDKQKINKEEVKTSLKNLDDYVIDNRDMFDHQGVQIGSNGEITNYTELMNSLYNQLHEAEDELSKQITEEERKITQQKINDINDIIKRTKELMGDYDKNREDHYKIQEELENNLAQQRENNLKRINTALEIYTKRNELESKYIEYKMKKIEDDIYKMGEGVSLLNKKISNSVNLLPKYNDYIEDIKNAYKNHEIDDAQYVESMENAYEKILDQLGALEDLDKEMKEYYGKTLEKATEEISKYTDKMENLAGVLDHYKFIVTLINGEQDYEKLGIILEGQVKNLNNQVEVAKKNFEFFAEESQKMKDLYYDALGSGNNEAAEIYKKAWDDAAQHAAEAQDNMLSKTEEWLEALKEKIENVLKSLNIDLEKALTGGSSFSELEKHIQHASSMQDEIYTNTNKIYEINKLIRQAQNKLDSTSNTLAKKKLNNFILQTKELKNQEKLSKFALTIQQKQYDLLLAEIALKEAQEAKNQMRLTRNEMGEFIYQYSADENKIADAQQKYEDAENALYNSALEGYNSYGQKRQEITRQLYDELAQLNEAWINKEITDENVYNEQKEAILARYNEKLLFYTEQQQIAISTNSNIAQESWTSQFEIMTGSTSNWKEAVNNYFENVSAAFSEWQKAISDSSVLAGISFDTLKEKVGNVKEESDNLRDAIIGTEDNPGVIGAMKNIIDQITTTVTQYALWRSEIGAVTDEYETLALQIQDAINKKRELLGLEGDGDGEENNIISTEEQIRHNKEQQRKAAEKAAENTEKEIEVGGGTTDDNHEDVLTAEEIIQHNNRGQRERKEKMAAEAMPAYNVAYFHRERTTFPEGYEPTLISPQEFFKREGQIEGLSAYENSVAGYSKYIDDLQRYFSEIELTNKPYELHHGVDVSQERRLDRTRALLNLIAGEKKYKLVNEGGSSYNTSGVAKQDYESYGKYLSSQGGVIPFLLDNTTDLSRYAGEAQPKWGLPIGGVKYLDIEYSPIIDDSYGKPYVYTNHEAIIDGDEEVKLGLDQERLPGHQSGEIFRGFDNNFYIVAMPRGWRRIYFETKAQAYATGGLADYTGPAWLDGTRSKPEIVLNPDDTKNFLSGINVLRNIVKVIDLKALSISAASLNSNGGVKTKNGGIQQTVSIDAHFPNAVDHNEIEEAFNSLLNEASQYINTK